uniref:Uncharacterized protein n=1 Tax=Nelumbo nucifera TaxID=4432 RepID=A0A822Y692_NELNU|nr:TPA_asm: hypothetical protein HUJ06_028619 [Nelumbo nucifera]
MCLVMIQALQFNACNGLRLNGLHHVNSPRNHISIESCSYATLYQLQINSPKDSPNTDGIDISNSTHVRIINSTISTGKFPSFCFICCTVINLSFSSNMN